MMEIIIVTLALGLMGALIACCAQSDEIEDLEKENGKMLRDWDLEVEKLEKKIRTLRRERKILLKHVEELENER